MNKKKYSEPDIYFENFALSTSIAAGCEKQPSNANDGNCGVRWGNIYVFTTNVTGCTSPITEGSTQGNWVDKENNGLCYHNPSDNFNVFNS